MGNRARIEKGHSFDAVAWKSNRSTLTDFKCADVRTFDSRLVAFLGFRNALVQCLSD